MVSDLAVFFPRLILGSSGSGCIECTRVVCCPAGITIVVDDLVVPHTAECFPFQLGIV